MFAFDLWYKSKHHPHGPRVSIRFAIWRGSILARSLNPQPHGDDLADFLVATAWMNMLVFRLRLFSWFTWSFCWMGTTSLQRNIYNNWLPIIVSSSIYQSESVEKKKVNVLITLYDMILHQYQYLSNLWVRHVFGRVPEGTTAAETRPTSNVWQSKRRKTKLMIQSASLEGASQGATLGVSQARHRKKPFCFWPGHLTVSIQDPRNVWQFQGYHDQ